MHGLVVGPRGEFSEDLTNLIGLAASAAARRHWADYGEASSSQARARFLRVFTSKIAVAAVRQQAVWMRTRLAQALTQKAGGASRRSGPRLRGGGPRWLMTSTFLHTGSGPVCGGDAARLLARLPLRAPRFFFS